MMEQSGESSIDAWLEQQVSWKGEDCGKVNEFMESLDIDSLPQSKSCMDTFLTPPFSLNTLCWRQASCQGVSRDSLAADRLIDPPFGTTSSASDPIIDLILSCNTQKTTDGRE